MMIPVTVAGEVQRGKIQYHVEHTPTAKYEYHPAKRSGMKTTRRLRISIRSWSLLFDITIEFE